MKLLSFLTILGILTSTSHQKEEKNAIRFEIRNAGITVNGHFSEFLYTIEFNPKKLKESRLEGRAVVSSISTGIRLRDNHLQGRQYFRASEFPEITMKSKEIRLVKKNNYSGVFEVTIKDITKEIEIPFTAERSGDTMNFKAAFTINRRDFAVGDKSLVLSDDVKVKIEIENPL